MDPSRTFSMKTNVEVFIFLLFSSTCCANVAYPGIWTGRQPDGLLTGAEQLLIGSPEYHFTVVESDKSFFPTTRGANEISMFATLGKDGRYLATDMAVGTVMPDEEPLLISALQELPHVIRAQCVEQHYCRSKRQKDSEPTHIRHNQGQVANLVVPFQFQDHANHRLPQSIQDLDQHLFNGPNYSVKDYFLKQSYGQMEVISEIAPWVTIPFTEAQCADRSSGLTDALHTCLSAALEQVSEVLNNGDVLISSVASITFVHSGYAAEYGGNDPDGIWFEDRIWSHSADLTSSSLYSGAYAIISDKYDRRNNQINRVGVAVHELAQTFGAPTLYGSYPGYGLGYYDVMSNPWGFDGTLTFCGSMSPYTKNLFGWVQLVEIKASGDYNLEHSYTSDKIYIIRHNFPDGEYLLIENRSEQGYDMGLSQPGLAIYHIDEKADNEASYPGSSNFPSSHYIASLVQGDGKYDIERMEEEGDSGDLFHSGRFTGIGPEGVILADGSVLEGGVPNTNSYQNGRQTATGIRISNISGLCLLTPIFALNDFDTKKKLIQTTIFPSASLLLEACRCTAISGHTSSLSCTKLCSVASTSSRSSLLI